MSMGLVRPRPGRFVLDICSAKTGNLHIHSSNNTWRPERQILKPKKLNNLKLWKLNPLTPTRFKDLCPIKGTQEWWLHPILAYTPKTVRLAVHLSNIFIPYIVPILTRHLAPLIYGTIWPARQPNIKPKIPETMFPKSLAQNPSQKIPKPYSQNPVIPICQISTRKSQPKISAQNIKPKNPEKPYSQNPVIP